MDAEAGRTPFLKTWPGRIHAEKIKSPVHKTVVIHDEMILQ
jgi:hypothetical protein